MPAQGAARIWGSTPMKWSSFLGPVSGDRPERGLRAGHDRGVRQARRAGCRGRRPSTTSSARTWRGARDPRRGGHPLTGFDDVMRDCSRSHVQRHGPPRLCHLAHGGSPAPGERRSSPPADTRRPPRAHRTRPRRTCRRTTGLALAARTAMGRRSTSKSWFRREHPRPPPIPAPRSPAPSGSRSYQPLVARLDATPKAIPVAAAALRRPRGRPVASRRGHVGAAERPRSGAARPRRRTGHAARTRPPCPVSVPPRAAARSRLRVAAAFLASQGPQPARGPPQPRRGERLEGPGVALRARRALPRGGRGIREHGGGSTTARRAGRGAHASHARSGPGRADHR